MNQFRWTKREVEDKERATLEMQDYKDQKRNAQSEAVEQAVLNTAFDMTRLCVQINAQLF
jgi:hypothetical protein